MRKLSLELNDIRSNKSDDKIYFKVEENFKSFDDVYDKYLELRRLALASPRTARLLAGKIGKDLANVDTEVTTA